jgi:hypothetical protein
VLLAEPQILLQRLAGLFLRAADRFDLLLQEAHRGTLADHLFAQTGCVFHLPQQDQQRRRNQKDQNRQQYRKQFLHEGFP